MHSGFIGKPKGKRPFKRQNHKWKNNIGIDLQEIE
jgi:hypothetical protein